jgi:hypothetical protein
MGLHGKQCGDGPFVVVPSDLQIVGYVAEPADAVEDSQ